MLLPLIQPINYIRLLYLHSILVVEEGLFLLLLFLIRQKLALKLKILHQIQSSFVLRGAHNIIFFFFLLKLLFVIIINWQLLILLLIIDYHYVIIMPINCVIRHHPVLILRKYRLVRLKLLLNLEGRCWAINVNKWGLLFHGILISWPKHLRCIWQSRLGSLLCYLRHFDVVEIIHLWAISVYHPSLVHDVGEDHLLRVVLYGLAHHQLASLVVDIFKIFVRDHLVFRNDATVTPAIPSSRYHLGRIIILHDFDLPIANSWAVILRLKSIPSQMQLHLLLLLSIVSSFGLKFSFAVFSISWLLSEYSFELHLSLSAV